MKKKILIGSIIAVVILTLVSFSSVVGYSSVKNTQEEIITDEYDSYTPIQLVLQLISKLRNHKDIKNVETENDVLQIIESDAELSSIIEKLESFDCGCEDEKKSKMDIATICRIIEILIVIPFLRTMFRGTYTFMFWVLEVIWILLDCRNIPDVLD